jgi:hypothetical protein
VLTAHKALPTTNRRAYLAVFCQVCSRRSSTLVVAGCFQESGAGRLLEILDRMTSVACKERSGIASLHMLVRSPSQPGQAGNAGSPNLFQSSNDLGVRVALAVRDSQR